MVLIAIDGPSGSGKSTLAKALSARLGVDRLDTGSMYRAVGLVALQAGANLDDEECLTQLAQKMELVVGDVIELDGIDVSEAIRRPDVTSAASQVAAKTGVRSELVRRQRAWITNHGGGVVEGRDIGSVVAPDADIKVFLTADLHERGRRRAAEFAAHVGEVLHLHHHETVESTMKERDARDTTRESSPLVIADGAVVIDSTNKSVADIIDEVLSYL